MLEKPTHSFWLEFRKTLPILVHLVASWPCLNRPANTRVTPLMSHKISLKYRPSWINVFGSKVSRIICACMFNCEPIKSQHSRCDFTEPVSFFLICLWKFTALMFVGPSRELQEAIAGASMEVLRQVCNHLFSSSCHFARECCSYYLCRLVPCIHFLFLECLGPSFFRLLSRPLKLQSRQVST